MFSLIKKLFLIYAMLVSTRAVAAEDWTIHQIPQPFSATLTATGSGGSLMVARCDDEDAILSLRLTNQANAVRGPKAMLIYEAEDGAIGNTVATADRLDPTTVLVTIRSRHVVLSTLNSWWNLRGHFMLTGSGPFGSSVRYGSDEFSSADEAAKIEKFAEICDLTRDTVFSSGPPFRK
jgi:hypothetical protein